LAGGNSSYVQLQGAASAQFIAHNLIAGSCWFEVTPLPDDVYEVVVKPDAAQVLRGLLEHFRDEDDANALGQAQRG
jgi:hypothetical protein